MAKKVTKAKAVKKAKPVAKKAPIEKAPIKKAKTMTTTKSVKKAEKVESGLVSVKIKKGKHKMKVGNTYELSSDSANALIAKGWATKV